MKALVLACAAIAACAGRAASNGPVATSRVDLPKSYQFAPNAITVRAGTAVTWANSDNFTHSVRLLDDGGAVLQISPGDSVHFTFATAGMRHYDCSFHPHDMHGTVLVTSDSQ